MSKTLIVDDTDSRISYNGNWQLLGALSETSHEYNGTIHRGDTNGQSISYSFSGTGISVYGSLDAPAIKGLPGVTFQVDNITPQLINSTGSLTWDIGSLTTHVQLYQSPNLVSGSHTLTITVTNTTVNGPFFYLDFFTIATGRDSVAGHVILDDRDESIKYVPIWGQPGIPAEYLASTSQSGGNQSTATLTFNGECIAFRHQPFSNFSCFLYSLHSILLS